MLTCDKLHYFIGHLHETFPTLKGWKCHLPEQSDMLECKLRFQALLQTLSFSQFSIDNEPIILSIFGNWIMWMVWLEMLRCYTLTQWLYVMVMHDIMELQSCKIDWNFICMWCASAVMLRVTVSLIYLLNHTLITFYLSEYLKKKKLFKIIKFYCIKSDYLHYLIY